jgi:hypothetical protein
MPYPGNGWPELPQQPYHGEQHQPYQDYQQQQFYSGYPGGPQPPARKKTRLWIGIGALVLVIAVGVTLLIVLTGKDNGNQQTAPPPSAAAASSTSSTSASSAPSSTRSANKVESTTPSWQGILSTKDNVAYDLPPDGWDTRPGFISGYDAGSVKAYIHESSTYRPDACPGVNGSNRGKVGFMTAGDNAVDVAARGSVRLWAQAAGTGADGKVPNIPLPTTTQLPINGGKIQATSSTVTFTPPASDGCRAPSVQVTSAAFKVGTQTVCFVMAMDQQVPDALPAEDAKKILESLRPKQP